MRLRRGHERPTARGFSLAEIILVIAVGTILLWSGTMMYLNAKDSAGMAKARDKVLALQQVVEQMASNRNGDYPGIYQVAQVWREKRAGDVASSPWGGKIFRGYEKAGDPTSYAGITGVDDIAAQDYPKNHPIYAEPPGTGSFTGVLEYRRILTSNLSNGIASFWDTSINASRSFRAYAVNIRDGKGQAIFFNGAAPPP